MRVEGGADQFARFHGMFVRHFAIATGLVWTASLLAATYAPWTRNVRGLIDPTARAESTLSFLFVFPVILALGWFCVACGGDLMRRTAILRDCRAEFAIAAAAAFLVFCLAIHRIVVVVSLGGA